MQSSFLVLFWWWFSFLNMQNCMWFIKTRTGWCHFYATIFLKRFKTHLIFIFCISGYHVIKMWFLFYNFNVFLFFYLLSYAPFCDNCLMVEFPEAHCNKIYFINLTRLCVCISWTIVTLSSRTFLYLCFFLIFFSIIHVTVVLKQWLEICNIKTIRIYLNSISNTVWLNTIWSVCR